MVLAPVEIRCLLSALLLSCLGCAPSKTTPAVGHLVIIVPGTYSNDDFWPTVRAGKSTFGSELQRALGDEATVHAFLWASSLNHLNRDEAANMLARFIDEQAVNYDRISLVGHSHGGNVALLAAGRCDAPLQTIVCLATPHALIKTKEQEDQHFQLPVYCSRRARENTQSIISVVATTDAVPDFWSSGALNGIRDNTAIDLSQEWQQELDQPRLADDSLLSRLLQQGNVVATRDLPIADHNIHLTSLSKDLLRVAAHHQIHSRQLGKLIGNVLKGEADALETLASTVIPADADTGEPEPAARFR